MNGLLDTDGENRAVRMFLALYGGARGVTTQQMRGHLTMAGFPDAWPEWANLNVHLTKGGAQDWLRHLFDLEYSIDMSGKRVHISDKNVHVPTLRDLNEAESLVLRQAGYNPNKFRRVLAFNDRSTPISEMPFEFRELVRVGLANGTLVPS